MGLSHGGRASELQSASSYSVAVPSAEELVHRVKREHPRLLIGAAGFEALRKKVAADPVLKQWDAKIQRDANRFLEMKLPEHVISRRPASVGY